MSKNKKKQMFSLKDYLRNKAVKRATKLQFRYDRRQKKLGIGVEQENHQEHNHEHEEVHNKQEMTVNNV